MDEVEDWLGKLGDEKRKKIFAVSAQNGIDVEKMLAEVFGESQTMRMVINYAGNLNTPNTVKVTFFNPPNYIASLDDSNREAAESLSELFNSVELTTKAIDSFELLKRTWEKTILNSALSALCGIGRLTIKEAMEITDTVEIVEQIIEEAVEVASAEKIYFPDDFIRTCLRYLKKAGNHFPSLAVDLINNRQTEIDFLNGKIVEYGRKHYIRTSLNLGFTNMVKAMTHKNLVNQLGSKGVGRKVPSIKKAPTKVQGGKCYTGIDLGSAYTKFTVIDNEENIVYQTAVRTLNRDKIALKHVMEAIRAEYPIMYSCATGYGRKHFADAEMIKTEINCGAAGVSKYCQGDKNIIDIGGEDIKIINCDKHNNVENFYLNDKCAAGTGSFLTEIAERAEINLSEMSNLASKSNFGKELNSFCTVFAKTEIMAWMFDGKSIEDISRAIYLSIVNRVSKLRLDQSKPVYMIGGVIAYHPYIKTLLEEKIKQDVQILEKPQHTVSLGAALIAKNYYNKNEVKIKKELIES